MVHIESWQSRCAGRTLFAPGSCTKLPTTRTDLMLPRRYFRFVAALVCAVCWLVAGPASAQVKSPPPPKEYDVQVRFRIRAPLNIWPDEFDKMVDYLQRAGFVRDARPADEQEDPDNDVITGHIASENAHKLLLYPAVQTLVARPRGYAIPANPDARVKVSLELAHGSLPLDRQRLLMEQTLGQLDQIGFREMVGYDHRGFTRILGTIDAYHVDNLLRDLRGQPSGWLVPRTPISVLPAPIRNVNPIRFVAILPEPNDVPPYQEPPSGTLFPPGQQHLAKLTPEVRAIVAAEKDDQKRIRLETVLIDDPRVDERYFEQDIRTAAPGTIIEGRVGSIATVWVRVTQVPDMARAFSVIAIRTPRSGEPQRRVAGAPMADILAATRLSELHNRGFKGKGIKIAVIDGDFGGYEGLVGKRLPKNTTLIDFTAARNVNIEPDPMPTKDGQIGQGTACALAVAHAAPEADLLLVRIDPASPYQLMLVMRLLNQETPPLENLNERSLEIAHERERLQRRRTEVLEERRKAIEGMIFEEGNSQMPEEQKRYKAAQGRVKKALADLEELTKEEKTLEELGQRFLRRTAEITNMNKVRVVVSTLLWNEGHPLDGGSALSRYFDDKPFVGTPGDGMAKIPALRPNRNTLWFQAAGDSRGQTWSGLFRDLDGNGVMDFAPQTTPLKKDRWTSELNFLGFQAFDGRGAPDVPEKSRLRLTIQWREPHDPAYYRTDNDLYLEPVVNLNLLLLRQRDPSGERLATDEMEVVARTTNRAIRIQKTPTGAVYEQTIDFTTIVAGRYALRVEGFVPRTIKPVGVATIPNQEKEFALRPRIFVDVMNDEARSYGRPLLLDYASQTDDWPQGELPRFPESTPEYGCVGTPADARTVISM